MNSFMNACKGAAMEPYEAHSLQWPYPVDYNKEHEIYADVLVIGGGIAGCHAAINAAKRGVSVAVVDKGPVIRSGCGGAGVDHWHCACTNPASRVTPEDFVQIYQKSRGHVSTSEYGTAASHYILCRESYDALLDVERMGIKVRDVDDEFVGADFRDEATKLMFAYDYDSKYCIRVAGAKIKPALYREVKRQGVKVFDRIMATRILTEDGEAGARAAGATGVNVRTGEFFVFKSKAVILTSGPSSRLWVMGTELNGAADSHDDPNCAGDGNAMAWRIGAEFALMEASGRSAGPLRYPAYGTGNAHNTWYACNMVDTEGKEVPWVDRDGRVLKSLSERYRLAPGQDFFYLGPPPLPYEIKCPQLIPDLPERIRRGEFKPPFFADLPSMPPHERRAIFGLMVANEGKTLIPIYDLYTKAGFDPDKDMLQANILPVEMMGQFYPYWNSIGPPQWRDIAFGGGGGVIYDWDLRTSIEGLYAAGNQLAGGSNHAHASTTGRYAGRKAAEFARSAGAVQIRREQIEQDKKQVYAPVNRTEGMGWKELRAGLARVMQDHCGAVKSESILKLGLEWLDSICHSELQRVYARNPHELMRVLECRSRLTVGEMVMHASLARKAGNSALDFHRLDYPEMDPPEWDQFVTIQMSKDGSVKPGKRPGDFWVRSPHAPTLKENYDRHCGL
jgi:succinate dehydrogenase/fumarate reductase flavoprotein subunit